MSRSQQQPHRGQLRKHVFNGGRWVIACEAHGGRVPTSSYFSSTFSEDWDCFFWGKSSSMRLSTCTIS